MALGFLGGAGVGGAAVELLLDDAGFNRGLAAADAKLKGFEGSANTSMSRFSQVTKLAFAAGGVAAVAFAAVAIKAYMEHQAVLAQLQTRISKTPKLAGETTAAFEEQALALEKVTARSH